jgi:formamidopyrimidine-DNA glycosylase
VPELPEVETTRRGIEPHVIGQKVASTVVRERRLRWPIPVGFEKELAGRTITATRRRAKYLLIDFDTGCLLIHLGMSGSLRMVAPEEQPRKHDHVDIEFR